MLICFAGHDSRDAENKMVMGTRGIFNKVRKEKGLDINDNGTLMCCSWFPNENANLSGGIFPLPECDRTSDGPDVNEAAEEMWAKYQIHHRQVDRCDLVYNILPNLSQRERISHNCDNEGASSLEETADGQYSSQIFMAFYYSFQSGEKCLDT